MQSTKLNLLALFVLLGAFAAPLPAQDSWLEEFSNDQDAPGDDLDPVTRDPINLELGNPFAGVPPIDWNDLRNGWGGLIEEKHVAGAGAGYPGADPGAATSSYGVLQPQDGNGSYWLPATFNQGTVESFNIDIYADPAIPSRGFFPNGGQSDWWWTNAIGPGYLTESGLSGNANPDATWTFSTTSGVPLATVPVGSWYEMEVYFTQGADGTLDVTRNLWDATHSALLGTNTDTTPFQNPVNQPMAPYYSWFTYFTANIDVLFVDEFRVTSITPIPEPSTIALFGMGAIGMVAVVRRRRRA